MSTSGTANHRTGSLEVGAAEQELALTLVLARAGRSLSSVTYVAPVPLTEAEVRLIEERARELIEQQRRPAAAYPRGLTEREVEVLKLIAAGRRNQQIADELVISLFTVARHVSNIFVKTGAANRAEAAVFAARYGLLDDVLGVASVNRN